MRVGIGVLKPKTVNRVWSLKRVEAEQRLYLGRKFMTLWAVLWAFILTTFQVQVEFRAKSG